MKIAQKGAIVVLMLGMVAMGSQISPAEDQPHHPQDHVFVTPGDLTWQDGPPSLPPGAQFAVIEGDPKKEGLFTMRLKLPAEYRIPAHWHPADEHVTVISGTFNMGTGDVLDTTNGTALPAGSFAVMPAQMHHFAWTSEATVLQLHGVGPWQINYLNPADDPRTQ
ncbi:MAG: cupin domain-containing protein [Candidatus Omnitrophota bacterium]|nr:cupin domain-containing protein [Candidatus Omnitrophota bacterium]